MPKLVRMPKRIRSQEVKSRAAASPHTTASPVSRDTAALRARTLNVRSGFLLICEFSASGGVEATTQRVGKDSRATQTLMTYDDPTAFRDSKKIVNMAHQVAKQECVATPLGYFADDAALVRVNTGLVRIAEAAKLFNAAAEKARSARRMEIAVYPIPVPTDSLDFAARLGRFVRERLEHLRGALANANPREFHLAKIRAQNLPMLAADGIQHELIALAIRDAKLQKKVLLKHVRQEEEGAAAINLKALDSAIALFA